MLIRQGEARSYAIDRRLACTLATIAGAVNTVAFHAVGFFSANMTGNVSSLSDRLAYGEWIQGAFYLAIVLTFIFGASASTLLINVGHRRQVRSIYAVGVLAEAILMGLLALLEVFLVVPDHAAFLVLGLSFLMGYQNAIVTRISDARVRTTHVSGMSTDIGIEFALLLDVARGREASETVNRHRRKLALHVQTVLSFLLGGIIGVVLLRLIGLSLLFVASAILLMLSMGAIVRARRSSNVIIDER